MNKPLVKICNNALNYLCMSGASVGIYIAANDIAKSNYVSAAALGTFSLAVAFYTVTDALKLHKKANNAERTLALHNDFLDENGLRERFGEFVATKNNSSENDTQHVALAELVDDNPYASPREEAKRSGPGPRLH